MKPKARAKILVDLAMTVLLLFQMGYHLWGERTHEWTGAVLFLLFLLHQLLNRSWYKSLFHGKYTPLRIFWLVVDLLVLAAMATQLYSGIILSRYVFRFLPIHRGMALARRLHILGAYWGYLFIGLHLGLHWGAMLKGIKKRFPVAKSSFSPLLLRLAGLAAAVYGAFVLWKRNLAENLFLKSEFVFLDYEESRLLFFLDYLAMAALCVFIAHYLAAGLRLLASRKERTK